MKDKVIAYIKKNPDEIYNILDGVNKFNQSNIYFSCQLDLFEEEPLFPFGKVKKLFSLK